MKCLYTNPTIQQCVECSFDDCVLPEKQDHNEYASGWRNSNLDKARASRVRYYYSHQEEEKAYNKRYYSENKEKLSDYYKERNARKKAERVS